MMTTTDSDSDSDAELVLTKSYDTDLVDDVEVPVTGDIPTADLADAVHDALEATILHLLDGQVVAWDEHDGRGPDYTFEILGGMPEFPVDGANGHWAAPYRTREKFEGADGSGDGLLGNLPDGWSYEVERGDSLFGFYRVK